MAVDKAPDPSRRSERSRQAILAAATDLICEVGYAKLAVEAIAARAGVGKQTIYRWWPDKSAVVFDAFLDMVGGAGEVGLPDTGDLEKDLKMVLHTYMEAFRDERYSSAYRGLLSAIQQDPRLDAALGERLLFPVLEATKVRLRSAQAAGQVGDVDLSVVADLLYGAFYYRWLLHTGPLTGELADEVVSLVMRAIRP
jgi:AcrR family transcriptional regulator